MIHGPLCWKNFLEAFRRFGLIVLSRQEERFVKSIICCLLILAMPFESRAAKAPSPDFSGLAQDDRKLADVGTDFELRIVTIVCDPKLGTSGFPKMLSVVYLTGKTTDKTHRRVKFPEGTEFKLPLTLRPDGSYETVYYRDESKHLKLY